MNSVLVRVVRVKPPQLVGRLQATRQRSTGSVNEGLLFAHPLSAPQSHIPFRERVAANVSASYRRATLHLEPAMSITTVFTNNRSQAVRLPADVRLPEDVKKGQVRARGMDRIISPVSHTWDAFFMNGPQASEDFMVERTVQSQTEREMFRKR